MEKVDTRSRSRASSTSSVSKTGKYSGKSGIQDITQFLSSKDDNKLDMDPLNPPNGTNDKDTPPSKNKGNKKRGSNKNKENVAPEAQSEPPKSIRT